MTEPTFKVISMLEATKLYEAKHDIYVTYGGSSVPHKIRYDPDEFRLCNPTFYITTELHNKLMNKRTPQQAFLDSKPAQEAWLAGKPIQFKFIHDDDTEYKDFIGHQPGFCSREVIWRPKPEPEKVPFNQQTIPADAWFRFKDNTTNFHCTYKVTPKGISLNGTFYTYEQLTEWVEHSTDRINWLPCYTLKS